HRCPDVGSRLSARFLRLRYFLRDGRIPNREFADTHAWFRTRVCLQFRSRYRRAEPDLCRSVERNPYAWSIDRYPLPPLGRFAKAQFCNPFARIEVARYRHGKIADASWIVFAAPRCDGCPTFEDSGDFVAVEQDRDALGRIAI